MIISHLVAVSNNNVIGKDNDLPWKLKKDLLHFKNYTIGKTVLMGRKTFESIGRPLPDRTNFIISNTLSNVEGAFIYKDLNSAINNVPDGQEVVIIGGGYLFRESINYFNKLVITLVDCLIEDGDIFYPEIDLRNWKLEKEDVIKKDHDNEYNFKVRVLTKNS
ncbi:MAG: dihydrofolate reductase [SAR86 cluster bacterium]|nr:dihydrofolate reductase [SAR86 cluster bacterium]